MEQPYENFHEDNYCHDEAQRDYRAILSAFISLNAESHADLADAWCDTGHIIRQRIGEIRRDLRYASQDDEAWQIVKYRVKNKLVDLQTAYAIASDLAVPPNKAELI